MKLLSGLKNATIQLFSEDIKASSPINGTVIYPKHISLALEEHSSSSNMIHALHRHKNRIQSRRNLNLG